MSTLPSPAPKRILIGPYELSFPCQVMTGEKPPFKEERHFWLSYEGGEGMSVAPARLVELFDELWKEF